MGRAAASGLGRLEVEEGGGGVVFGQGEADVDGNQASDTGPVQRVELRGDGGASGFALDLGSQSIVGGTGIVLNGGDGGLLTIETGEDAVRFNGPVMLQTDVRIDTDAAVATGAEVGDVLWTNDAPIDSADGEASDLVIDAGTARVLFNEDVGASAAGSELGQLEVEEAGGGVVFGEGEADPAGDAGSDTG